MYHMNLNRFAYSRIKFQCRRNNLNYSSVMNAEDASICMTLPSPKQ